MRVERKSVTGELHPDAITEIKEENEIKEEIGLVPQKSWPRRSPMRRPLAHWASDKLVACLMT